MLIRPIDRDQLRKQVREATPFPHFCIDDFLEPEFAEEVSASFPSFDVAESMGKKFAAVNERNKIQIADSSKFPDSIYRLHEALASQDWLDTVSYVMDIPNLLADPSLAGGGIHETGPRGHLDVHVDFNYLKGADLHRRLNILIYFNKNWKEEWGGNIELWDKDVSTCHHSFSPIFNRCVVFETNDVSFHGVTAVQCPDNVSRKSFAAYYYTREAPPHWTGEYHSTVFRARPNERVKGLISMPAERLTRSLQRTFRNMKRKLNKS